MRSILFKYHGPISAVLQVRQLYVAGEVVDSVLDLVYMIGPKICQKNFVRLGICHGGSHEASVNDSARNIRICQVCWISGKSELLLHVREIFLLLRSIAE